MRGVVPFLQNRDLTAKQTSVWIQLSSHAHPWVNLFDRLILLCAHAGYEAKEGVSTGLPPN